MSSFETSNQKVVMDQSIDSSISSDIYTIFLFLIFCAFHLSLCSLLLMNGICFVCHVVIVKALSVLFSSLMKYVVFISSIILLL